MPDYIPRPDIAFADQLRNFKTNIGSYSAALGLTTAQITAQAADSDYFGYIVACQQIMQNGAVQWTAWKNIARGGENPPSTGVPAAPVFPAAVPAVAPGIEPRFRALCQLIKNNPAVNDAMLAALGILAAQQTGPDFFTLQPELAASISGDKVEVDWGWGGYGNFLDMLRLEVDRNDGKGFVLLAIDTTPGYIDSTPFPTAPAKWTYRATYMVGDSTVGQWSKPVSVTVGG